MRRLSNLHIIIPVTIALLVLTHLGACQNRADDPVAKDPMNGQTESFTGVLQSGIMAIGGETTGWRLVGDGETGGIEIDVSNVRDRTQRLDGQRVTVTGKMIDHDYVERGKVRILVAHRIEPAPTPR